MAGGSNEQLQAKFVKISTNAIKKVSKYCGERRMNGYILTVGKSNRREKSAQK